jgi:hypothetical protein
LTALRTLEKDIEKWNIPVYNLYGGFAVIRGAEEVTWDDVFSRKLLSCEGNRIDYFHTKLNEASTPLKPPQFICQPAQWTASVSKAEMKIETLSHHFGGHQQEIISTLNELISEIDQNSLCRSYLYNEINAIEGMLFVGKDFGVEALCELKETFRKMKSKILEMGQKLTLRADVP